MKQISFFRMLDLSELATTARDLTPLLKSFRDYEPGAVRAVEERWKQIAAELDASPERDLVVLVSDGAHLVLPRANATRVVRSIDVELAEALAREPSARPTFDVVVEHEGKHALLRLEHQRAEAPLPQIDWSRSFTLWNIRRERDAHYVFLDTGEAVVTWFNLASLLGCSEEELTRRAGPVARSFTIAARHGDAPVACVRIDLVETFLAEIER